MIIKCPNCNKLLLKIKLNGYLRYEIKCPRCNHEVVSVIKTDEYTVRNYKNKVVRRRRNENSINKS